MRELVLIGAVALGFGLGSYYWTDRLGWFGGVNLAVGALALLGAAVLSLRGARRLGTPDARRVLAGPFLALLATLAVVIASERLVDRLGWSFDLTFEGRYDLADATLDLLGSLEDGGTSDPMRATLFCEQFDPRCRSTWLLLRTLSQAGRLEIDRLDLDEAVEEADRFGISSSNSVVLEHAGSFQTVERPSEGSVFEALQRHLRPLRRRCA